MNDFQYPWITEDTDSARAWIRVTLQLLARSVADEGTIMVTVNSSMDFVIFLGNANFGFVVIFNKRDQQFKSLYNHYSLNIY